MIENNKKIIIEPGCITCGMCEFIAPEIFEVTDIARVKDQSKYEEKLVQKAIQECPVSVIKEEEINKNQNNEEI
jgi:ferredoxin